MMLSDVCLSVHFQGQKVTGAGHIAAAPAQLVILSPSKIQRGDFRYRLTGIVMESGRLTSVIFIIVSRQSGV